MVFASGSCRLLVSLSDGRLTDGRQVVRPLHALMLHGFLGNNFLCKLHNTRQHIQFLRLIDGSLAVPDDILASFLTSHNQTKWRGRVPGDNAAKLRSLRDAFHECSVYMFEICSMKLYERDGYQVQFELTDDYTMARQTVDDLVRDLETLVGMVPAGRRIVFQSHFRPQIVSGALSDADGGGRVQSREDIFHALRLVASRHANVLVHDPSELIRADRAMLGDPTHFSPMGYQKNFAHVYETCLRVP